MLHGVYTEFNEVFRNDKSILSLTFCRSAILGAIRLQGVNLSQQACPELSEGMLLLQVITSLRNLKRKLKQPLSTSRLLRFRNDTYCLVSVFTRSRRNLKRRYKNKFYNFIKKLLTCIFIYDVMYVNLKLKGGCR